MSSLYDRMTPDDKCRYLKEQLVPGVILYLFCEFTTPPKPKYLALVCPGQIPLFFVINSRISNFIKSRDLETTQVLLLAPDYSFLDHDSWLDCSDVKDSISNTDLQEQLLNQADGLPKLKGSLNVEHKKQVVLIVSASKTISPIHKRMICNALNLSLEASQ